MMQGRDGPPAYLGTWPPPPGPAALAPHARPCGRSVPNYHWDAPAACAGETDDGGSGLPPSATLSRLAYDPPLRSRRPAGPGHPVDLLLAHVTETSARTAQRHPRRRTMPATSSYTLSLAGIHARLEPGACSRSPPSHLADFGYTPPGPIDWRAQHAVTLTGPLPATPPAITGHQRSTPDDDFRIDTDRREYLPCKARSARLPRPLPDSSARRRRSSSPAHQGPLPGPAPPGLLQPPPARQANRGRPPLRALRLRSATRRPQTPACTSARVRSRHRGHRLRFGARGPRHATASTAGSPGHTSSRPHTAIAVNIKPQPAPTPR